MSIGEEHIMAKNMNTSWPKLRRTLSYDDSKRYLGYIDSVDGEGCVTPDIFTSLGEVSAAIRSTGVKKCGLIFGIDYTLSNKFQGEESFGGLCLHDISRPVLNPYQKVICILGETLESFDDDGIIPAFGFGDTVVMDESVFPLKGEEGECQGFEGVLTAYMELMPKIRLAGPTNFAPIIRKAIEIVQKTKQYHILVICADGQVTREEETVQAIVEAAEYPLSITMIGVGDGPWDIMHYYDDKLPERKFDNFRFTDFHSVMKNARNPQPALALSALMEIPEQYNAIKSLKLLEKINKT